ncbi:unnamed protein product [Closterium sp. NIES-53]
MKEAALRRVEPPTALASAVTCADDVRAGTSTPRSPTLRVPLTELLGRGSLLLLPLATAEPPTLHRSTTSATRSTAATTATTAPTTPTTSAATTPCAATDPPTTRATPTSATDRSRHPPRTRGRGGGGGGDSGGQWSREEQNERKKWVHKEKEGG